LWEHFQNVESLHEETHVEPGPIALVRPEGCYPVHPQMPAWECNPEYVVPLPEGYGRWSYPSVFVAEDRVLISHTYSVHDSTTGEVINPGGSRCSPYRGSTAVTTPTGKAACWQNFSSRRPGLEPQLA